MQDTATRHGRGDGASFVGRLVQGRVIFIAVEVRITEAGAGLGQQARLQRQHRRQALQGLACGLTDQARPGQLVTAGLRGDDDFHRCAVGEFRQFLGRRVEDGFPAVGQVEKGHAPAPALQPGDLADIDKAQ